MVGAAFAAAGFFGVEVLVGFRQEFLDALAVAAVNRDADAGRKNGLLGVGSEDCADTAGDQLGFGFLRLWED